MKSLCALPFIQIDNMQCSSTTSAFNFNAIDYLLELVFYINTLFLSNCQAVYVNSVLYHSFIKVRIMRIKQMIFVALLGLLF